MKINRMQKDFNVRSAVFLLVAALLMSAPATAAEKNEPPATTPDGLKLVTNTGQRVVYMADDVDLAVYTKVMIVECAVAFAKNWQRDYNRRVSGLDGRVSDKDVTRMKDKLSAEFKKVFTDVMTDKGHEVVTEAAADVLVIRPAIINLVVSAPAVRTTTMSRNYVSDPGQMTLYMELYDSVSGSILAYIEDAKDAGRMTPTASYSNSVTNISAADRILKSWSEELAGHMGEVTASADEQTDADK